MRHLAFVVAAVAALPGPVLAQAYYIPTNSGQVMSGQVMSGQVISGQVMQGASRPAVAHTGSVPSARNGVEPGSLGGGFIEFLFTGRDGSAHVQRPGAQPAPRSARPPETQPLHAPITGLPPLPAGPQVAAIPSRHDMERPIERILDPKFARQEVEYSANHAPGTIVIDTGAKFLYLMQGNGRALRYGIGVGRPGFEWRGVKSITRKAEWPDWRPPEAMLRRRPDLPRFMEGGENNPLGARALYLGSSLYRIHGTNEPHTIGQALSSGCFRMLNDDVIDLYNRVRVGTRVIVM